MKYSKSKEQLNKRIVAWDKLKPEEKKACRCPGSLKKK